MQVCKCGKTSLERKFYNPKENICEDCYFIRRQKSKFKKLTDGEKIAQKIIELYRTYDKPTDVICKCVCVEEQEIIDFLIEHGYYHLDKKRCGKCNEIFDISEFASGQLNPSGWCKKCIRIFNDQYYIENSEFIKEKTSEYYYAHWDYIRGIQKTYRSLNKESLAIQKAVYNKIYNQRRKQEIYEYHVLYNIENRALKTSWGALRRAAKLNATVKWSNKNKIIKIYKEANRLTKETGILHVVDHIHPLQGKLICGLHVESNLQILTVSENCSKSNKFGPYMIDENGIKIIFD
jgi:hypothetical protein